MKDRETRREQMSNMIVSKDYFNLKGKDAEKVVHELALKTFLTDWCYLNPLLPNGKELCDLLVVFDEIAIIWQIKDLKLDEDSKHNKSEIEKNLRQLSGARRVLFDLKAPVELENPRRTRERLDPTTIKEVYLVSVLLGQVEEEFNFVESIKNHTVHVFAGNFTQIVLNELDTIADFVAYLREKETFLAQDRSINILGGEDELLGCYLANNRSFATLSGGDYIILDQGFWERVKSSQEYKAKKKEDEISYIWDNIINRVHEGSAKYEIVARNWLVQTDFIDAILAKYMLKRTSECMKIISMICSEEFWTVMVRHTASSSLTEAKQGTSGYVCSRQYAGSLGAC